MSANDCIGAAGAVRIDRVLREAGKGRQRLAERVDVIGVAGDAGDDVGVAGLHRPRRAAQRDDAARAAKRNVIEPARRQAEMLREPDRGVRPDGEARYRKAVDVVRSQAGAPCQRVQGAADPPLRAVGRIAPIRDGDRQAGDNPVVGLADRA